MHAILRRGIPSLAILLLALAPAAQAQAPSSSPGRAARLVVIRPKPGQQAAFEAGYRRHLEWHRAARDPWTWYGWSVVFGPRLGLFVDGTFGHSWAELDRAVDPAGDAADNAANVIPHGDFLSHAIYERLPEPRGSVVLPDTSPFLVLTTYRVVPGQGDAFEAMLRRLAGARGAAEHGVASGTWYRAVVGTDGSEYLLMRSARGIAELEHRRDPLAAAPGDAQALLRGATTEVLRYRRDLSYAP